MTSVVLGVFFILMRFYFFGSPEFVVKRDAFVAKFGFSLLFSHLKVGVFFFFFWVLCLLHILECRASLFSVFLSLWVSDIVQSS